MEVRALVVLGLLLIGPTVYAQSPYSPRHRNVVSRVWHGIGHHKLELLYDGVWFAAEAADAGSSVAAQRTGNAVELNPALGPHPSAGHTWAFAMGGSSAAAALTRMIFHYADSPAGDKETRAIPFFYTLPLVVLEARNVSQNAKIAESEPASTAGQIPPAWLRPRP